MRIFRTALIAAAAACAMGSLAAIAAPGGNPGPPPWAGGPGGNPGAPGQSRGAPGPIAGAGLPFLIVAGGYMWIKRRRNRARQVASLQN
jgi:hypothetical protein